MKEIVLKRQEERNSNHQADCSKKLNFERHCFHVVNWHDISDPKRCGIVGIDYTYNFCNKRNPFEKRPTYVKGFLLNGGPEFNRSVAGHKEERGYEGNSNRQYEI